MKMKMKNKKIMKMKIKILRINQNGYVSGKKIDISRIKLTPKKRKEYLEELDKIELWCKKNE